MNFSRHLAQFPVLVCTEVGIPSRYRTKKAAVVGLGCGFVADVRDNDGGLWFCGYECFLQTIMADLPQSSESFSSNELISNIYHGVGCG